MTKRRPSRLHPIRRDAEGRSARERAFELFEQGLRPSELPDLGVTKNTLFRYYESWKHRAEESVTRAVNVAVRHAPDLQQGIAEALGITERKVEEAFAHRNGKAALQRTIRRHLLNLLDRLDNASPEEIERVGRLLHAYRGRDRSTLLDRFIAWPLEKLDQRARDSAKATAILMALHTVDEDAVKLRKARHLVRKVVF